MNCATIVLLSVGAQLALGQSCMKDGGCADPALATGSGLEEVDSQDATGLIQSAHAKERMESPTAEQRSEPKDKHWFASFLQSNLNKDKHWFASFIERSAGGVDPVKADGAPPAVGKKGLRQDDTFNDFMNNMWELNQEKIFHVFGLAVKQVQEMIDAQILNVTQVQENITNILDLACDSTCRGKVMTCFEANTTGVDKCVKDQKSLMQKCKKNGCLAKKVNTKCLSHPQNCTDLTITGETLCSMYTLASLGSLFPKEPKGMIKKGLTAKEFCGNFAGCMRKACGVDVFGIFKSIAQGFYNMLTPYWTDKIVREWEKNKDQENEEEEEEDEEEDDEEGEEEEQEEHKDVGDQGMLEMEDPSA